MTTNFDNAASVSMLMVEMRTAADEAANAWLEAAINRGPKYAVHNADLTGNLKGPAIGTMLDVCGNAWLEFTDKRSKLYRAFKAAGYVSRSGNNVDIPYTHRFRQEMSLHEAAISAAQNVMLKHGIKGTRVNSYID